jgi:hypothetical protein
MRDVGDSDACLVEAVLHRLVGEAAVMLASRKALFLSRSNDFAVLYQACGRIAKCS